MGALVLAPLGSVGAPRVTAQAAMSDPITVFPALGRPGPIVAGADGALWFGDQGDGVSVANGIGRITGDGTTAYYPTWGPSGGTQLLGANGSIHASAMAAGSDRQVWYVGDDQPGKNGLNRLGRMSEDGGATTEFYVADALYSGSGSPFWIVRDPSDSGSVWADGGSLPNHAYILHVTPSAPPAPGGLGVAQAIEYDVADAEPADTGFYWTAGDAVVGSDRALWFPLWLTAEVATVTAGSVTAPSPLGDEIGRLTMTSSGVSLAFFKLPAHTRVGKLIAGPGGDVWFTEQIDADDAAASTTATKVGVGRITTAGAVTEYVARFGFAVWQHLSGAFYDNRNDGPWSTGLTATADGDLWVDLFGLYIVRATPCGDVTVEANPRWSAGGIAAGPDHTVWFTDNIGQSIGRIDINRVPPPPLPCSISPGARSAPAIARTPTPHAGVVRWRPSVEPRRWW